MQFATEAELVSKFAVCLGQHGTPWGETRLAFEFDYRSGRTDVVALLQDDSLIAFEAKLTKWRDALHQAYRNTCFAHRSYVVLPERTALTAARYGAEFVHRNIGLCYLSYAGIVVVLDVKQSEPLQTWLAQRAVTVVSEGPEKCN